MAHGGKRLGAGRKTAVETKTAKNGEFDLRAVAALPALFDALQALAVGVKIAAYEAPRKISTTTMLDEQGETIYVYTMPPDKAVLMYLVDRASGKSAVKPAAESATQINIVCDIPRATPKVAPDADE